MNPTYQTEEQRLRAFSVAGIAPPTFPTTLNSTNTSSVPAITLPTLPMPEVSSLASLNIQDFIPTAQTNTEVAKTTQETFLEGLYKKYFGKGEETQQLETQAKIPELTTQYNEFNDQIRQLQTEQAILQGEASVIPLQIQNEFAGRGATRGGVQPIEAGRLRENAIKQNTLTSKGLFLSAMVETARGRLSQAEASVDRAIKLKYEPLQQMIEYQKDSLDRIYKDLDREDRQTADNQKLFLEERSRLLGIQREDEKQKQIIFHKPSKQVKKMAILCLHYYLIRQITQTLPTRHCDYLHLI